MAFTRLRTSRNINCVVLLETRCRSWSKALNNNLDAERVVVAAWSPGYRTASDRHYAPPDETMRMSYSLELSRGPRFDVFGPRCWSWRCSEPGHDWHVNAISLLEIRKRGWSRGVVILLHVVVRRGTIVLPGTNQRPMSIYPAPNAAPRLE